MPSCSGCGAPVFLAATLDGALCPLDGYELPSGDVLPAAVESGNLMLTGRDRRTSGGSLVPLVDFVAPSLLGPTGPTYAAHGATCTEPTSTPSSRRVTAAVGLRKMRAALEGAEANLVADRRRSWVERAVEAFCELAKSRHVLFVDDLLQVVDRPDETSWADEAMSGAEADGCIEQLEAGQEPWRHSAIYGEHRPCHQSAVQLEGHH